MPDQLYGFRPKQRTQYLNTDAVTNPIDPRIPRPVGAPPVAESPVTEQPYHSGPSAENEDSGPGNPIGGGTNNPNQASYLSVNEAKNAALAGWDAGYFGTVQDARQQAAAGNQRAANALGGFVQRSANNPNSFGPRAPGLFGLALHAAGIGQNEHGGVTQNVQDAIYGLEESGNLYDNTHSSGYQGNTLSERQNLSDLHAATVYGNFSDVPQSAPEVQTYSTADTIGSGGPNLTQQQADEFTQASQQANYDYYQDNSSDDNHGQTDGTQTGGETSHAGGYGGFADDAATSDGGGGGGK